MIEQVVQIAGAVLILLGFVLALTGRLDQRSIPYLLLNLIGSVILTILAYVERQWGFFLLEFVWAFVSLWGLYKHVLQPSREIPGAE